MATDTTFTPQVLGETEKALNALLNSQLATAGLTEHQWIALRLAVLGGGALPRGQFAARLAGGLKVSGDEAGARIDELVAAGLLAGRPDDHVAVTDAGRDLHTRIRGYVAEVTDRLWGDLPADDLAITARTLTTILARVNAQFPEVRSA